MNILKKTFLTLIIITQFVLPISSQVEFSSVQIDSFLFSSYKNCIIDMNGDMLDDLVRVTDTYTNIYYQKVNPQIPLDFTLKRIPLVLENQPAWSICGGDIDNNGFNELILGDNTGISFIRGDANGTVYFEEPQTASIFAQRTTMADINNDGHLDAFICNDLGQNHPYRNTGLGEMLYDQDLIVTPTGPGNYAAIWVDYDNDSDLDLYLSKCEISSVPGDPDRTNLLYNNNGLNQFTEVGELANMDDNSQSWVTLFEDFDNDGDFDAVIFNHDIGHRFMLNNGDGSFTNIISDTNLPISPQRVNEAISADFDNDGDMDILVDAPSRIIYNQGNLKFETRNLAYPFGTIGDLNSDGFIDLYNYGTARINQGNENHWLRVNLVGRQSNRNGIGSRIDLYGDWGKQTREVRCTQSYSSMNTLATHFGIGQYTEIDSLIVKWPSGHKTVIIQPQLDTALVVDESDCPFEIFDLIYSGNAFLCEGDELVLKAPDGYENYFWSNGDTTQETIVSEPGSYNVTVEDNVGCSNFSSIVEITGAPAMLNIEALDGFEFCSGGQLRLDVATTYDIVWSDGQIGNQIIVDKEGAYSAIIYTPCNTEILTDTIVVSEIVVETPEVMDTYIDAGTGSFVVSVSCPDAIATKWYASETSSDVISNMENLFLSNFQTDSTFYVECVYLSNGKLCVSERVPANIFYTTTIDLESKLGLKLYPNPTQESVYLELNEPQLIDDIDAIDVVGEYVSIDLVQTIYGYTITFKNPEPGIYFLKLSIGGQSLYRRVVINK